MYDPHTVAERVFYKPLSHRAQRSMLSSRCRPRWRHGTDGIFDAQIDRAETPGHSGRLVRPAEAAVKAFNQPPSQGPVALLDFYEPREPQ